MPLKTKGSGAVAAALLALSMALTGCEDIPWNPDRWGLDRLDVLSINGRTGVHSATRKMPHARSVPNWLTSKTRRRP